MSRNVSPAIQFTVLAFGIGLATSLGGCKDDSASAASPPPESGRPVLVQRVSAQQRIIERSFVGTVRPRVESDLGFRVQGKVARRLVNVGDVVKAGTALASLDEVDLRLQTEQAEAERGAATMALSDAEATLKRTQTLTAQGWTAQAILDRQKAATEEARSRSLRAERGLVLARNAFSYAVLYADADGVVTATLIEPGQVVAPGQAAIRLAHTAEKEAVVAIPEALVSLARDGRARLGLWSNAKLHYSARLRELSPAADAMTRTYLARFSLPDADGSVQLGMTATVTLSDAATERVVRVPLSALVNQGGGPSVWTVQGERLTLKPVTVSSYDGQDVLLADGLSEGEQVVRLGVQKLDAGQRVRVVETLQF